MAAQPVEWVLLIHYGPSAHRATYGRLDGKGTKYTKDYIQLSRKKDFLDAVTNLFSVTASGSASVHSSTSGQQQRHPAHSYSNPQTGRTSNGKRACVRRGPGG